jgi:hypothetical protein
LEDKVTVMILSLVSPLSLGILSAAAGKFDLGKDNSSSWLGFLASAKQASIPYLSIEFTKLNRLQEVCQIPVSLTVLDLGPAMVYGVKREQL